MNWFRRLRHKWFGAEYVMFTNSIGDLLIRRAKKIGDHWYIFYISSRYRLLFDGSIEGWLSDGLSWKPITDYVPHVIATDHDGQRLVQSNCSCGDATHCGSRDVEARQQRTQ